MAGTIREQLKALEQLQELDLKIDSLKKQKNSLPAAEKALQDSLDKALLAVNAKKAAIAESEKVTRQAEAALELNRDRLTRANSKLDAVGNSQEYSAANREIEQLKKSIAGVEESLKRGKADQETLAKELATLEAAYTEAKGKLDAQVSVSQTQGGQLDGEVAKLVQERTQFTGHVEVRVLAQYDRVRGARAGLGIVPAVGGRCRGCNMMVAPQLYIEIQRCNTIHACPSCHRLLYIPAAPGSTEPATASA